MEASRSCSEQSTWADDLAGITRCDMIAESIIAAATELGPLKVPIVARLQGTNSAEGLKLVSESETWSIECENTDEMM